MVFTANIIYILLLLLYPAGHTAPADAAHPVTGGAGAGAAGAGRGVGALHGAPGGAAGATGEYHIYIFWFQ